MPEADIAFFRSLEQNPHHPDIGRSRDVVGQWLADDFIEFAVPAPSMTSLQFWTPWPRSLSRVSKRRLNSTILPCRFFPMTRSC